MGTSSTASLHAGTPGAAEPSSFPADYSEKILKEFGVAKQRESPPAGEDPSRCVRAIRR